MEYHLGYSIVPTTQDTGWGGGGGFISYESPKNPQGPIYMSQVPETTLPFMQIYQRFKRENVVFVGRVKVDPA